jgi:16S rRNA (cytidine1402-2'-O)-methyltransferase
MPGTLYVVATPIGNLGDLSPRAAEVLRSVAAIVAEDTRRSQKLLAHLGVPAPAMLSLPAFDERGRIGPVLARLAAGEDVALCTDAGTPGVSDPGQQLVAAAWNAGARVVPIPGPCAAVAALVSCGLPSDRFFVQGFLPRKGGRRAETLAELAGIPATLVVYEAGNRTGETLSALCDALGDRSAAVARELTKVYEEISRGTLSELAARFAEGARGEVTIVIGAPEGKGALVDPELLEMELARGGEGDGDEEGGGIRGAAEAEAPVRAERGAARSASRPATPRPLAAPAPSSSPAATSC